MIECVTCNLRRRISSQSYRKCRKILRERKCEGERAVLTPVVSSDLLASVWDRWVVIVWPVIQWYSGLHTSYLCGQAPWSVYQSWHYRPTQPFILLRSITWVVSCNQMAAYTTGGAVWWMLTRYRYGVFAVLKLYSIHGRLRDEYYTGRYTNVCLFYVVHFVRTRTVKQLPSAYSVRIGIPIKPKRIGNGPSL